MVPKVVGGKCRDAARKQLFVRVTESVASGTCLINSSSETTAECVRDNCDSFFTTSYKILISNIRYSWKYTFAFLEKEAHK